MAVMEPFNANSKSLANFNSNWAQLGWAAAKGQDTATGWAPSAAAPAIHGAYTNAGATDVGRGVAAQATLAAAPAANGESFSLWIDAANPASASRGGYELRATRVASGSYDLALSKWSAGVQTSLATKAAYALPAGTTVAIVDKGSTVSGWVNTGSGFVKALSATDTYASAGQASIQASGSAIRLSNFKFGTVVPNTSPEAGTTTEWRLRNSNSAGNADIALLYGSSGLTEVVGDWNGDGKDTIGTYNPTSGVWKLRNSNGPGPADITFAYGGSVWPTPVVGDWNNDGIDTIGVFDPSSGTWALRNSNTPGNIDIEFSYGGGPVWPNVVVGDWNNDGTDTIGVFNPTSGTWALRNSNTAGNPNIEFQYGGGPVWPTPVAGDWNNDGTDTIGVHNLTTGAWALRNSNTPGSIDIEFLYGGSIWKKALVGDWDGNGTDTPGVNSD